MVSTCRGGYSGGRLHLAMPARVSCTMSSRWRADRAPAATAQAVDQHGLTQVGADRSRRWTARNRPGIAVALVERPEVAKNTAVSRCPRTPAVPRTRSCGRCRRPAPARPRGRGRARTRSARQRQRCDRLPRGAWWSAPSRSLGLSDGDQRRLRHVSKELHGLRVLRAPRAPSVTVPRARSCRRGPPRRRQRCCAARATVVRDEDHRRPHGWCSRPRQQLLGRGLHGRRRAPRITSSQTGRFGSRSARGRSQPLPLSAGELIEVPARRTTRGARARVDRAGAARSLHSQKAGADSACGSSTML